MTSATYTRLRDLFLEFAELPAEERTRRLDVLASADPAMAARLRTLLGLDDALAESTVQPVADRLSAYRQATIATDVTGLRLGAFVIRREISSGGMGRVFLAERDDGTVEQRVAVKLIRPELFDDAMRRRFHFERQALASLEHRDIAGLIDAGELPDGTPYLVMEFVDGEPVTDYADRHALDLRARLKLVCDVCDAVAYAHRRLIVHRDLKPGNVMVDANGAVKLLDFGIAKPLRAGEAGEKTATANRFWSPYHAAPELWRGEDVGVACDVYGIGMLLYELLSGRLPFDVERMTPGEIENAVLRLDAPAPSERVRGADERLASARKTSPAQLVRQLRGDLDSIVGRCLRKQPQERYTSVEALVQDIDAYLDGRPVAARKGRAWYVARKFVARHRIAAGAAAAIAVTIVASSAALWNQYRRTELQRDRAQAVTGFLVDTFAAADPAKSLGQAVTAKQLLDQAAVRVKSDLRPQPALKAELLLAIAEVNLSAGLPREAGELVDLAQKTVAGTAIQDGDLRYRLLKSKAQAEVQAMDYEGAERTIKETALLEVSPRQRIELQEMGAFVLFATGKYPECLARYEALVEEARRTFAPDDRLLGLLRFRMARCQLDAAPKLEILQALRADQLRYLSEDHPDVVSTTLQISSAIGWLGRYDEELRMLHGLEGTVRRLYGEDSIAYAGFLNNEGATLMALKRAAEAYPILVRSTESYRKQLGDSHSRIAMSQLNLANAADTDPALGHLAEGHFRQAIEIGERSFPDGHLNRLLFRASYGFYLVQHRRYAEAVNIIDPVLDMAERFPSLKTNDAYPFTVACRATANYGTSRTEANRVTMVGALEASDKATTSFETREMITRLTDVARQLQPASSKPPNAK